MTHTPHLASDYRQRRILIALLTVAILAATSLLTYLLWSGYQEVKSEIESHTRDYAAIIETRLDATLRRADAHLQEMTRTLPIPSLSKQAEPRYASELNAALDLRKLNFPELDGLRVFDSDGDQLYTTDRKITLRGNVVDRGYFRLLRDDPQASLAFETNMSRSTGLPTLVIARALRDGRGAFHGIVIASVGLKYFQKLFQSLNVGALGVASIYRSDVFTPVVRWPAVQFRFDKALPPGTLTRVAITAGQKTGTLQFLAAADGAMRIYSFHVLDRYPFYVTVGIALDDALVGWRRRALTAGLTGLLLMSLLAALLFRLWRAEEREALALSNLNNLIESDRKIAAENLRTEKRLSSLLNIAPDAVIATDAQHRIIVFNKSAETIFGHTAVEIIGRPLEALMPARYAADHGKHLANFAQERDHSREMGNRRSELIGLRKDGTEFPIDASISILKEETGPIFFAVLRDATEKKLAAQKLEHRATHDSLTGLPNRILFTDRLTHALDLAEREERLAALLFLDLDGFKRVNDTLGHAAGDELLRAVAQRLQESVRRSDTVARLGGDEFAVILEQIEHVDLISAIAAKINSQIAQPFQLAQGEVNVSTSIGITISPFDSKTVRELMVDADRAMYAAKAAGKNRFEFYSAERATAREPELYSI